MVVSRDLEESSSKLRISNSLQKYFDALQSDNLNDIENLIETSDKRALSFIADIVEKETGSEIKSFCDALKSIAGTENDFGSVRPNDLYRDIIRKIVKILLKIFKT